MATLTAPNMSTPERSLVQRMEALAHANDVRSRRAVLKRDIKAGRQQLVPLLADPPEYLATMKVADLLIATPKIGRVKLSRILRKGAISTSKTVGGLSERQRRELCELVVTRPL